MRLHIHHIHRVATILKRKSLDCVGEEVGIYRCCKCHKEFSHFPLLFGNLGRPENDHAYTVMERV